MRRTKLVIENFGPIGRVEIPFADITVLVGPQATGKSLVLQWLKLAIDQNRVLGTLAEQGFDVAGEPSRLLGWFFGAGYSTGHSRSLSVHWGASKIDIGRLAKGKKRYEAHQALFVPAHRTLVFSTGWPLQFRGFGEDTPFVVREFSERVRELLAEREDDVVFPASRRFHNEFREALDGALFHGGKVVVESKGLGGKQLQLVHGRHKLSIMEWTTGQREVLPLLAGLYEALPSGGVGRRDPIEWVIVEEPELGLHPDGIVAVLALLLEVARRDYRLVLSTHSSVVLDVLWAIQRLANDERGEKKLLQLLGIESTQFTRAFARAVLDTSCSIIYLDFQRTTGKVRSTDISNLDPASPDMAEAEWGGLIRYSSRAAEVLSEDT